MDNFWKEAVKVTGPIAVVGFILAFVVEKIFQENVLVIFGSDRVYYLTFFIIAVLAFALVLSVIFYKMKSKSNESEKQGVDSGTVTINRSQIAGDIVIGNKTIKQISNSNE